MVTKKRVFRRIVANPKIMGGKPVIKGTRVPVEAIVKRFAESMGIEDVIEEYPNITREDILAALEYSAHIVKNEKIIQIA